MAKKRRFLDASKVFTRAIQLDTKDAQAYYLRGHARVKLKQIDGAIRDFKRTVSLDRQNAQAFFYLGSLLARMEDWEKALWCFEEASKLGHQEAVERAVKIRRQIQGMDHQEPAEEEVPVSPPPPPKEEETEGSHLRLLASPNGRKPPVVPESETGEFISPALSEKMRKSLERQQAQEEATEVEDDYIEEEILPPADLVDVAADILKRFAKAQCGVRIEMQETIKKGLFGLGKKVEKKVVRWRVRVKKRISDDHTGLLGEKTLGATLELHRKPITRIRVSLPEPDIYRVELQVEKAMGGMLKHQLTSLGTVWKREIPADADTLNDALQILLAEGYLVEENGRLVYRD